MSNSINNQTANFTLWLEFEHWESSESDDPENDFFNMKILLSDGRTYALNVWTFQYLEQARIECPETKEYLSGKYLPAPDLFVDRLDRGLMEKVVLDLVETNSLKEEWLIVKGEISRWRR